MKYPVLQSIGYGKYTFCQLRLEGVPAQGIRVLLSLTQQQKWITKEPQLTRDNWANKNDTQAQKYYQHLLGNYVQ